MVGNLILIKHAMPVLDAAAPASTWVLGEEGRRQACEIAERLRERLPFELLSSAEPKARETAEIIAAALGIQSREVAGLEEIDRPTLPIVDAAEHASINRPLFEQPEAAVLGSESADQARERFSTALLAELAGDAPGDIVVITHGTVMSLFAEAHSPVSAWSLWKRLACGDALRFELPGLRLVGASTPEEVMGQYESHAAGWDRHRPRVLFERTWLNRFLALVPEGGTILDLGCGAGEPIARYFIESGRRVCGIDSSPSLLALCRDRFPEQEWQLADMRHLDLGARFDGIIAWDSFFHLSRDDQRRMFAVFERHAGPRAALMYTSGAEDGEVIGVLEGDPLYHASLAPVAYRQLLAGIGFSVVSYVEDDPECAGHTVWLAERRSG